MDFASKLIVDTCSAVAFDSFEVRGKKFLELLSKYFRIAATPELVEEAKRCKRSNKFSSENSHASLWIYQLSRCCGKRKDRTDWEGLSPILSGTPPEQGSLGEVSISWFAVGECVEDSNSLIIVTDDKKARNLLINELCDMFPQVTVLSSVELARAIIIKEIKSGKLTLDQSKSILHDLIASLASNTSLPKEEISFESLTANFIQLRSREIKKLKNAEKVIRNYEN